MSTGRRKGRIARAEAFAGAGCAPPAAATSRAPRTALTLPLSPRLAAVAALVPPGLPMADVGTDHGRLPVALAARGQVPLAIGCDLRAAPLAVAERLVRRSVRPDAPGRVLLRPSDGCAALGPDEVRTLTICGMGGPLIAAILAGAPPSVDTLVLQPNMGEAGLRAWLAAEAWAIDAEQVVRDSGRWFVLFRARRGVAVAHPAELAYGAVCLHVDVPALLARLADDEARLRPILVRQRTARGRQAVGRQLDQIAAVRAQLSGMA